MNTTPTQNLKAAALAGVLALTSAQAQTVETRIGKLEFEQGVPTKESVTRLYDEMDFQRACQAYLWALPIVASAQAKLQHELNTGARDGDIAIYEGYRNVSVWLTANATTPTSPASWTYPKEVPSCWTFPQAPSLGRRLTFGSARSPIWVPWDRIKARAPGFFSLDPGRKLMLRRAKAREGFRRRVFVIDIEQCPRVAVTP